MEKATTFITPGPLNLPAYPLNLPGPGTFITPGPLNLPAYPLNLLSSPQAP